MVNNAIEKNGDGLLGLVLGTKNIKVFNKKGSGVGYPLSESAEGEGESEQNERRNGYINFCHQK